MQRGWNFKQEQSWDIEYENVELGACYGQFSKRPVVLRHLLVTGDRLSCRCQSLRYTGWGIGLADFDPAAADIGRWRGQNLLGQALQTVWDLLKKQPIGPPDIRLPQATPQPANGTTFWPTP